MGDGYRVTSQVTNTRNKTARFLVYALAWAL